MLISHPFLWLLLTVVFLLLREFLHNLQDCIASCVVKVCTFLICRDTVVCAFYFLY